MLSDPAAMPHLAFDDAGPMRLPKPPVSRKQPPMSAVIRDLLNALAIVLGAAAAHAWAFGASAPWMPGELLTTGGALVCQLTVLSKRYSSTAPSMFARKLLGITCGFVLMQSLLLVLLSWIPVLQFVSRDWFVAWTIVSLHLLVWGEIAIRALQRWAPARSHIVIVGNTACSRLLLDGATCQGNTFTMVGSFNPNQVDAALKEDMPALGSFEEVVSWVRTGLCNELWLALPLSEEAQIRRYVTTLQNHLVNIRLFPDVSGLPLFNHSIEDIAGRPAINLVASPSRHETDLPKAMFDRLFAMFALVALSPLLLAIAAWVKYSSPGPVLFRQRRKGIDGNEFTILKFRSMRVHAETKGTLTQASRNDERVTPVGHVLRKLSLDELPQFINVLCGHMSVVGPRPHAPEHDDHYMRLIDGYMHRYRIKPGITGWAQVNGFRGETQKVEGMAARVSLDLFYIQNWSFWLDLKIVAMTIFKSPFNKNAY
jgi:putative colanic acid biosynthesis UDP-glucose lipid carrier transferase